MNITSLFGDNGATELSDELLIKDALGGLSASCNAYLNATLMCNAPELRALFSDSLSQLLIGHSSLGALAAEKDWIKPYEPVENQLIGTMDESEKVLQFMQDNFQ